MNAGTSMRARADIRARWGSLVATTIVIGLAGAISMAAFTGAGRAESAYVRFRDATNEPAVIMFGGANCPFSRNFDLPKMAALPQVRSMQSGWNTFVNVFDRDGQLLMASKPNFDPGLLAFDWDGQPQDIHPHLLEGRYPTGTDEALVGWTEEFDGVWPEVGQTIDVTMLKAGAFESVTRGDPRPQDLIRAPLTIVGRAILPGEMVGDSSSLAVAPAFAERYGDEALGCEIGAFQLHRDTADAAAFWTSVKEIAPESFGFDTSTERTVVERSSSLQAIMLRLFGGLAAVAALLVLGQVLIRRTMLGATDAPVLRALGMGRTQLVRAALVPAVGVAAATTLVALVGAVVLSSFTPFGQVRIIEPTPGMYVDGSVLLVGSVVIVIAVLACVAIPAWRTAHDGGSLLGTVEYSGGGRPSRIARAVASLGLPVSAVAGTRLALEPGHGRSATPVRSAIIGLTLAVTAMVAAFGFAASMDRFTSTPMLWGIGFDFATGHPFIGSRFQDKALPIILDDPGVGTVTGGNFQEQIGIEGPSGVESVAVWGTEPLKGEQIDLSMLDGRWPRADDEIALGTQTARSLGVGVGDTVHAQRAGDRIPLTVVGIPVFPDFGFGPGLGQGAGATMSLVHSFYPEATTNLLFARFAPGADRAATVERLNAQLLPVSTDLSIELSEVGDLGSSLVHTRKSRGLPLVLAAMFGIVAFASLVHVLVTSVRRRRRDLAILRTIGFRRRQIAATIAWQATTIATLSLLIGVPVGFLVGRFVWALFADRLGVISEPAEAWFSALIVVPTVLVLANLVAIGPALFARRTQPAQVLRAE